MKKTAILFSGGKDSTYAAYLAKKEGYEITCLITIFSSNKESYMFHTPSITETENQAKAMGLPIMIHNTLGKKEAELKDLEDAIKKAKKRYDFSTLFTGALHSEYQASRIEAICKKLKIKCINPLWHKDEIEYLKELLNTKFKIMIIGIFAFPLDKSWLGRIIDKKFIEEVSQLKDKYKIHAAGEGGEFETFVLNCPLFKKELEVVAYKDIKEGENSWRREIEVE